MAAVGVGMAQPPEAMVAFEGMRGISESAQIARHLVEHEEEVTRNAFSIHAWLQYLQAAGSSDVPTRSVIFERALQALPRSYKLWTMYLEMIYETQVRGTRIDGAQYEHLIELYERALVQLQTMPRVWINYLQLLQHMQRVTASRRVFDRALRALPVTQHHRIWPSFLAFLKTANVPRTLRCMYRRYLMLEPTKREEYVEYLCETQQFEPASEQLVELIQHQATYATTKSHHALWMQLCDMVSQHPQRVSKTLDIEAILRSGIAQFTDEVGRLWCSLATYYVRLGLFECARDIYEEGIQTVVTVRDFSMIFDAYVQYVEALLTTEMQLSEEDSAEDNDNSDHQVEVERLLKIYEDIAERRPILLNSVLLRQNPNNVREWEKRVELVKGDPAKTVQTYAEAVQTVDPLKSGGRLPHLWTKFATYYEHNKRIADARAIFKKAAEVEFKTEQELATLLCDWANMELRVEDFDEALNVVRRACEAPQISSQQRRNKTFRSVKEKVHTCVKLWTLRLDLEESLGDIASTRSAYDQAFDLKIITPQMVLHYATFLEENKFFEEAFRVYERGLAAFPKFPHAFDIWNAYLAKFVKRYGGRKVERARDLHEQAISAAPAEYAKALFLQYAEFEEQHGVLRNVMNVFERSTDAVPEEEKLEMYQAYIKKAHKFFGVAKVREIYQRGIDKLSDRFVPPLSLQFAAMETKLGEIERARAIYAHASQFCDPRTHEASFWSVWHEFEVVHGSEHTFLEMLRIKRSVVAQYSTVNYIAEEPAASSTGGVAGIAGMVAASTATNGDAMAALEADVVAEHEGQQTKRGTAEIVDDSFTRNVKQKVVEVANEEEIELDDDDEEGDDANADADQEFEERALPDSLFGSAKQ